MGPHSEQISLLSRLVVYLTNILFFIENMRLEDQRAEHLQEGKNTYVRSKYTRDFHRTPRDRRAVPWFEYFDLRVLSAGGYFNEISRVR